MDSAHQQAVILFTIPNVQLCIVQDDITQLIESTEMNFARMPNNQVFINIGQHIYTLQKSIPIYLTSYESSRSYLYSFIGEIYSIILQNATCQQFYEQIDKFFDQNALLVIKDKEGDQFQNGGGPALVAGTPNQPKSAWQTLSDGAVSIGSSLQKGIVTGGVMLTEGILSVGNFIESQITNTEEVKISDSTKQNVKMVKDASGKVLEVSGAMAAKLIEMNVTLATMMADTVVSVAGLKNSQHPPDPKYDEVKQFGKTSLMVTLGVLDSLDKAASCVGKTLGQQMTRIVEKKYGKEASGICTEGVEIAGNAGQAYKDFKNAEIKAIARATAKETVKQVGDKV